MASKSFDAERLAATEKHQEELLRYLELFAGAFDELHGAIIKQINTPAQYIGPHHDYPVMSLLDSGFPSFHEAGFNRDSSPRDYGVYFDLVVSSGFSEKSGVLSRASLRGLNWHPSCEVMKSGRG